MAAANVNLLTNSELDRIIRWRIEELIRAGFEPEGASELAARLDIDLHEATDLVKRGCPAEIALRILL